MERCLIFTFDNFKYSYVIVGLLMMHNIYIFAFLMTDIFMIVVIIAIKLPLPLKTLKLDFAKAYFFIILIWLSLIFSRLFSNSLHRLSFLLRRIFFNLPRMLTRVKTLWEWIYKLYLLQHLYRYIRSTRDLVSNSWRILYSFILKWIFKSQRL